MKKALVLAAVMACATPAMAQVNFSENFESYTPGAFFNPLSSYTTVFSTTTALGGWGYQRNYLGDGSSGTTSANSNARQAINRLNVVRITNDDVPGFAPGNKLLLDPGQSDVSTSILTGPYGLGQWFRQVTSPGIDNARGTRVQFQIQMRDTAGTFGNEFFLSLNPSGTSDAFQNYIAFKAGASGTQYPVSGALVLSVSNLTPAGVANPLTGVVSATEVAVPFTWDYSRVYNIDYTLSATGLASLSVDGVQYLTGQGGASFVAPTGLQIRSQRAQVVLDNLTVSSVPEPSAAMAVVVPAVAMLRRRRK